MASIHPEPDPAVMAAISAAVLEAWPRPVAVDSGERGAVWRFSGRWWVNPPTARRDRLWATR